MSVTFRNVDVDPYAPVDTWPYEAIVTVIERGTVRDWVQLTREVGRDPWGPVARQIEEYLSYESPYGVGSLLSRAISRARADAQDRERAAVAAEVTALLERSGMSMTDLAVRIGTSRSRLSTYCSGRVSPSSTMLERLRNTVARLGSRPGAGG